MPVKFNRKEHCYSYRKDNKSEWKRMYGTTKILEILSLDEGAIEKWAKKTVAEKMAALIHPKVKITKKEMKSIVDEAIQEPERIKETAARIGKEVHKGIAKHVKKCIKQDKGLFNIKYREEKNDKDSKEEVLIKKCINAYIAWARKNKVKHLESEFVVYDVKRFVAGTLDLIFKWKSKIYIVDIKTSNGIYDIKPFLQVGNYRECYESMNQKHKIDDVMVIRIDKTKGKIEEDDIYLQDLKGCEGIIYNDILEVKKIINKIKTYEE